MKPNLLNQPLRLPNGTVLRNRLAKAAMSETLGTYDNRPTPDLVQLYRRWAASGLGLIITGNVMVDRRALGEPGNVAIEDEADLPVLRQWAQAATGQGAAIWAQLNHPGKQSTKGLNAYNLAPSAVPFRKDMAAFFETPREATPSEIQDIIERFGRSAAICKKAGFSGVQIHGAHGYLVSQFLSPHHNRRSDGWGGTPKKRRRFVLAVYAEIRRQVGPDFPVGIKLNSADFQRGGFTEEESIETIRALADAGIDLIEISGGTYEAPAMSGAMQEREEGFHRGPRSLLPRVCREGARSGQGTADGHRWLPHGGRHERRAALRCAGCGGPGAAAGDRSRRAGRPAARARQPAAGPPDQHRPQGGGSHGNHGGAVVHAPAQAHRQGRGAASGGNVACRRS